MANTVGTLFLDSLASFPDRSFLRHRDNSGRERRWTYREAAGHLAAIVHRLEALGLGRGERVLCFAEDMVPSVFFQIACAHVGITTVFVSPLFSIDLIARLVQRLGSKFVFTTAEHASRLSGRPFGVEQMNHEASVPANVATDVLAAANAKVIDDDVYIIQPTSGSTGDPKLAMRTHGSMVRSARHHALDMRADDVPPQRILMVASLTHAFGQSILACAVRLGAELAVPDAVDVSCSLEVVRALDPTYLLMPPRVMRAFDQQSQSGPLFGPSARLLQYTGAPGDVELLERISAQGVNIIEMYGSTETGQLAMTRPGQWRPGVVGPPLDDVELVIADDGELLARSPGRMLGYFGDEALTAESFTPEGLYRTGDYAELTEDRFLRILGRKRDVFNTQDGANIYPARIELAIEALEWVHQIVLVGDQRPFVIALVTVEGVDPGGSHDGWLDPARHDALYARARAGLAEINAGLEPNERVRRFALFGTPMAAQLYAHANLGKTRRDRRGLASAYAGRIEALYEAAAPQPCVVPGP